MATTMLKMNLRRPARPVLVSNAEAACDACPLLARPAAPNIKTVRHRSHSLHSARGIHAEHRKQGRQGVQRAARDTLQHCSFNSRVRSGARSVRG